LKYKCLADIAIRLHALMSVLLPVVPVPGGLEAQTV
jgi:hypothetical protein